MFSNQNYLAWFLLLWLSFSNALAQVSLVLGGGGARGVAHVVVLQALAEAQVPVERVVGTSMGAVVGGLYAAGFSAKEIAVLAESLDWEAMFVDSPPFTELPFDKKQALLKTLPKPELGFDGTSLRFAQGLLEGQQFDLTLRRLFLSRGVRTFADMPLPFTAVATDVETGAAVLLQSGDVVRAIRASLSVPSFFAPVLWEGRLLVDGGVSSNVPIAVAKAQSSAPVIAVSVDATLQRRDQLNSPLAIGLQVVDILMKEQVQRELALLQDQDLLLTPELSIKATDFSKIGKGLDLVFQQLPAFVDALQPYSKPHAFQAAAGVTPAVAPLAPVIQAVTFSIDGEVQAEAHRFSELIGKPLDSQVLESAIASFYAEGVFSKITYDLKGSVLIVNAQRKPWGPGFLHLGIALDSDFAGRNRYSFGIFYQQRLSANQRFQGALVSKDAETNLEGQWQWALASERWLGGLLRLSNQRVDFYQDGKLLGDGESQAALLALTLRQGFGKTAELGFLAGWQGQRDEFRRLQDVRLTLGQGPRLAALFQYNRQTTAFLPQAGQKGDFVLRYGQGSQSLWQARWRHEQVHSFDFGTLTWRWQLAGSDAAAVPIQSRWSLGGRNALLAFGEGELPGRKLWYSSLAFEKPWRAGFYWGTSFEAAEVWQQATRKAYWSAGLTLRRSTPVGELFLGYALGAKDSQRLYFSLGTSF